ncbi:CrcB family protein [Nocardioides hankookensis]
MLGTGFCGGFTTYSAFAVQTHGLGRLRATAYAVATIGGALVACALGFTIGQA